MPADRTPGAALDGPTEIDALIETLEARAAELRRRARAADDSGAWEMILDAKAETYEAVLAEIRAVLSRQHARLRAVATWRERLRMVTRFTLWLDEADRQTDRVFSSPSESRQARRAVTAWLRDRLQSAETAALPPPPEPPRERAAPRGQEALRERIEAVLHGLLVPYPTRRGFAHAIATALSGDLGAPTELDAVVMRAVDAEREACARIAEDGDGRATRGRQLNGAAWCREVARMIRHRAASPEGSSAIPTPPTPAAPEEDAP